MVKRNVLMNPGPATTTDSVKQAQIVPDICPREKEFGLLMEGISKDLVSIAGGDEGYVSILIGGSGTAGMDSVLNSVVNGRILIINNGAYGKRFLEIAKAYDLDFKEIFFGAQERIDIYKIEEELKKDPSIKYLAMIHHETTTGILNPVKEIGEIAKKHGCIFIVDAISSFAGIPFNIKDSKIDFMISTSNKCIQGMPGICFVICKKEELEKIKEYKKKSFYLNLYKHYESFKKDKQSPFTPPVQTVYALRKAIDEFLEEENRYERYTKSNRTLVEGMEKLGFKKFLHGVEESQILTTFWEPENPNYSFEKMHDSLYDKGFTIYPGKITQKTFRLANMGAIDKKDIENFLNILEETLKEMGVRLI